jgi:hypothetical protein
MVLKPQGAPSWDNYTTHTVSDSFSPSQNRTRIASVKINLIQHSDSCQIATTSDNWNINGLQVQIANPGPPLTIVNLGGNPLVRLTESSGSISFTTIYHCR